MPAQGSAFEQAVRVGDQSRVHIVSAFHPDETRCGLREQAPLLLFTKVDAKPDCAWCARPEPRRLRRTA